MDADRVYLPEGGYTYRGNDLALVLRELDARTTGANAFTTITRTAGLITKIEYFKEVARTNLTVERDITYTSGLITSIVSTYYNADASVDSIVTETVVRDGDGLITSCDSVFSTSEDIACD